MHYVEAQALLPLDELQNLVAGVTYKRGYELKVYYNPYEGIYLSIIATVPNSYNQDEETELRINSPIPNIARYATDTFYEWLLERLIQMEIHEACEFFQVEGVKYYDPHHPIEPE